MEVAHENDIDIEGACEGSLACSTCHVYVDSDYSGKIPEATETEDDLLDSAPGLQENSRLSCQIKVTEATDGCSFKLPAHTKNFYVDGHKPKPH